jgi:uncharacterized protein with LGFP repeats
LKTKAFAILIVGVTLTVSSVAAAYQVYGAIAEKWRQLGSASGPLGAPKSDESAAARGGRFNEFQYGFIYWHPNFGAHAVYGLIGEKWNQLGRERGFGYPLTDEQPAQRGGRFNDFENGGSIYWHPSFGAHAVYGTIREKWSQMGREAGGLGYPITDELPAANGARFNNFEFGMIYWQPNSGAHAVYGRIGEKWIQLGRESGICGYPTSDEYDFDDGRDTGEYGVGKRFRRSNFTNGYILWSKARNQTYVYCRNTPSNPPPSSAPKISVEFVRFSGQSFGEFKISGSGFRPNGQVTIRITSRSSSGGSSTSNTPTQADGNGNISLTLGVSCNQAGTTHEFTAIDASGNTSPTVGRSCP